MLPPETNGIAASQPGVKQNLKPHPLPCSDWPSQLVSGYVLLGPRQKPVALRPRWISHVRSRIGFDQLCPGRPSEKPAHRIEKIASLRWRFTALDLGKFGDASIFAVEVILNSLALRLDAQSRPALPRRSRYETNLLSATLPPTLTSPLG